MNQKIQESAANARVLTDSASAKDDSSSGWDLPEDPMEECLHGQDAPCSCACPFSLDVRDFVERVRRGMARSAYRKFRDAVLFPEIVLRLCPAPCRVSCAQRASMNPLDIPGLEKAAAAETRDHRPARYNMPLSEKTVAILGGGLQGLACARKLADKGYRVSMFESGQEICPGLEQYLPREAFEEELRLQFQYARVSFSFGADYQSIPPEKYSAVFLTEPCPAYPDLPHVFSASSSRHPVLDIANGIRMSEQISWYLKTGSMPEAAAESTGSAWEDAASGCSRQESSGSDVPAPLLSAEEAKDEAARCTKCDCDVCLKDCIMLRQFGKTVQDLSLGVKRSVDLLTHAQSRECMRQINGCNYCGLCEEICPKHLKIGRFLYRAKTELFEQGILSPAQQDFWMRDMAFADEEVSYTYYPAGKNCRYIFFPGCQLGGSDPRYVTMTYRKLLENDGTTTLLLRCCGAPALWAANQALFRKKQEKITRVWEESGHPVFVLACPSCYRIFRTFLPAIPVRMYFEMPGFAVITAPFPEAAVFDPCSSRKYPDIQNAVRRTVTEAGITLSELKFSGKTAQCCSYGGHTYTVAPNIANAQAQEQAELSPLPYIVYCVNCRDIFASRGKDVRHLLDLILGINPDFREAPTVSGRRENRRLLREELQRKFPAEAPVLERSAMLPLHISSEISSYMNEHLILEEDISRTIQTAEEDSSYIYSPESGHRFAHLQIAYITYWVEYLRNDDNSFTVLNTYSHRMSIGLSQSEAVNRKPY